jgi:hypothetical protein
MSGRDEVGNVGHQKYPSCFFFSIDAAWSWSINRPWRSLVRASSISWMMAVQRVGLGLDGARQRVAAEGAEAHLAQHRLLAGGQPHALVVDHDQRAAMRSTTGRSAAKYSGTIGMPSRWMYCQMSSSVQLDSGNTRIDSPWRLRPL